jgi:hypothetical protein
MAATSSNNINVHTRPFHNHKSCLLSRAPYLSKRAVYTSAYVGVTSHAVTRTIHPSRSLELLTQAAYACCHITVCAQEGPLLGVFAI